MSQLNVGQVNVGNLLASGSIKLPSYTNSNRPASPDVGLLIFNTEKLVVQVWTGDDWADIGNPPNVVTATGGTQYVDGQYTLTVFTSPGTFQVTSAPSTATVDLLVVGGGGQGAQDSPAGGGGGGGFRFITGVPISSQGYSISVGQLIQGNMAYQRGNPSSAIGYSASGGGSGAGQAGGGTGNTTVGYSGGSGGGGGSQSGGSGNEGNYSPPEGFSGAPGSGGGGGAGGNGQSTTGGPGAAVPTSFLPAAISAMPDPFLGVPKSSPEFRYFGGGGGGYSNGGFGIGGGGAGGNSGPRSAIANRGGGGGAYYGPWTPNWTKGESGVVIIRHKSS